MENLRLENASDPEITRDKLIGHKGSVNSI